MDNIKQTGIAFRADGNSQIGTGHIMRCLALARELHKYNSEIFFISRSDSYVRDLVLKNNFRLIEIGEISLVEEAAAVKDILRKNDINIVVTDSYSLDQNYLEQIYRTVDILVTIDDLNLISFPSHIIINGNIYAPRLNYHSTHGQTEFLLGTSFTLMREEFLEIGMRHCSQEVNEILVTSGGSDPLNLTPLIIRALDKIDIDFKINVVIGPGFRNLSLIEDTVKGLNKQLKLLHNVENISSLMLSCDIAITAGGITLYELARTGTPAVVLLQAKNQITAAKEMNAIGNIVNMGMGNELTMPDITSAVYQLCRDWELRQEMIQKGQALVDGLGTRRCARIIIQKLQNIKKVGF